MVRHTMSKYKQGETKLSNVMLCKLYESPRRIINALSLHLPFSRPLEAYYTKAKVLAKQVLNSKTFVAGKFSMSAVRMKTDRVEITSLVLQS